MAYIGNVVTSFNVATQNINNDAITTEKIADGAILNIDVNSAAAIAGTKISPDFGSQTIATTGVFSHALGAVGTPSITFTGDLNTGIWSPAADTIAFAEGGVEAMRIDSSGRVGIGTTSPGEKLEINGATGLRANSGGYVAKFLNSASTGELTGFIYDNNQDNLEITAYDSSYALAFKTNNIERMRLDTSGRMLVGTSSSASDSILQIRGTAGDTTAQGAISLRRGYTPISDLSAGSTIGKIDFEVSNGGVGARIAVEGDAAMNTNDYPSRLTFSTTADGASSPTERGRIISNGHVKFSNTGSYLNSAAAYHEIRSDQDYGLLLTNTNASLAANVLEVGASRSANSAYRLAVFYSSYTSGNDIEFNLRGDGNAYADGTWNGGGADYAELFEWNDSNPDAEDRRGISVVLDGDKIREAVAGEDPIGVISGNPSVVGDAAWNKWSGKYLRDEFNSYLLDENGDRQLNPAFNPDVEYVSREQRPEWDCVGLMGKLRVRKGQVTGSRWIKMRDISATVEEWLVR